MFRRGFYLSELVPLLLSVAMLGMAVFGLATGSVWSWVPGDRVSLVAYAHDPGLFWVSVIIYLVAGAGLGVVSIRTLRGY
jgi:hypothetical protein